MITQLEQHFCEEVLIAIALYENNFRPANKSFAELAKQERHLPVMSAKRSADVSALRQIVLLPPQYELTTYLDYLNNRLKKMKTGWWFFNTGRSRLKRNILQVMERYQKPETLFYLRRISELEQHNQWLVEEGEKLRNNAALISQQRRRSTESIHEELFDDQSLSQKIHLSESFLPSQTATSLPKSGTRWFNLFGKKSACKERSYSLHTVEHDEDAALLGENDDRESIYSVILQ